MGKATENVEKFGNMVNEALKFAMANKVPPLVVIGILESIKINLVDYINKSAEKVVKPNNN